MNQLYDLTPGYFLTKNYKILEFLGHGWEGEVYKIEEQQTGILRAAKMFYPLEKYRKNWHVEYAKKLFRLQSCPIIIQYHHKDTVYVRRKKVDFLVSDYVNGLVLSNYIKNQPGKRFTIFEALHIFYAIVKGIEHIHFLNEYHGDIHSDNIIVNRSGLEFNVRLIDILHLGRSTKERMQTDVFDLINILYELIGKDKHYKKSPKFIKAIILGRKKNLLKQKFQNAGQLRLFMENLGW